MKKDISIHRPRFRWLSYGIVLLGVIISCILWYLLIHEEPHAHYLTSLKIAAPWITLILGICISLLFALAIRLAAVSNQRLQSYEIVNEDFKKEMAERIRAEETKQNLEKALLQGQKLQAIGTLAGGIAHDFNNILYAITGYVEMAREDVEKDSLIHQNLGKVLEAAHRGQELVSRILTFSRRQHFEFKTLDLKTTIEGVLALLKPTIPASVSIYFEAKRSYTILGNQTQLHQVMVNIINNAVDAMDGEGKITIKLSEAKASDPFLTQFPKMSGINYCKIIITDTGHGMDQTMIERIFEPFFTTKEVGKGTGLGLSTAHAIIKEHQGEIIVESQLGQGATFILLLPEYQPKENKDGDNSAGRRR